MAEYNDTNPIDTSKKYTPQQLAEFIRKKMYGKDVRESIALGIEQIPATNLSEHYVTDDDLKYLEAKVDRIVLGVDKETIELVVTQILKNKGVI